ncbi:MAG: D-glycero-alpha-D-manno-heptose-1,7-bisphosphate 7-phosphatase [Candidatus Aminicenantaceae bacterium]
MIKKRAVFIDRDGTINEDVGFPNDFSQINIYSYSFTAVRKLNRAGLLAVIITNQSGIGRGFLTEQNLHDIHQKMKVVFAKQNACFDGIYYCPHYLSSSNPLYRKDCSCRKPNPGMALHAASALNIDLNNSYMIGDKVEDMLFGLNINAIPVLVLTGFGKKSLTKLNELDITLPYVAQTLLDAVNWILRRENFDSSSMNDKNSLNLKTKT